MKYDSPLIFANGHVETILPYYFRRVSAVPYRRERILTPDDDFLDLDWCIGGGSKSLLVLSHGLEGSSRGKYIQGMVEHFRQRAFDTLAWNCRSCSGEINRQDIFYHSGASYDLRTVLDYVRRTRDYESIHLVGFSMGGNITLKYLGEESAALDARIKTALVFSVPCDLKSSAEQLTRGMGRLYTRRFVRTLSRKFAQKRAQLSKRGFDLSGSHHISDFKTWDDRYTAPLHGYRDAEDYWRQCSSKPFIAQIRVPTLIVNAANDPFLGAGCFPVAECSGHAQVQLLTPARGGHVGFASRWMGSYWSEQVAWEFARQGRV